MNENTVRLQVHEIVSELHLAWLSGKRPSIEDRVPPQTLEDLPHDDLLELVLHEFRLRRQFGQETSLEFFASRFPRIRDDLERALTLETRTGAVEGQSTSTNAASEAHPSPPVVQVQPKSVLGNYELTAWLGDGGMGVVYRARHMHLKKEVAVKLLTPAAGKDAGRAMDLFQREMQAVGAVEHPNIVRALDAGQADGLWYLAMELVPGCSLEHRVRERGPLPVSEAVDYARQIALGLQHAHSLGMVHRDIKPSNSMLTPQGVVKILDLGLARILDQQGEADVSGTPCGTVDYMAPEVWEGKATSESDLYALGCTLFKLLTGKVPFANAKSLPEKMHAHLEAAVPNVRSFRPEVPIPLAELLASLMEKRAVRRPPSAAEVIRILDEVGSLLRETTPSVRTDPAPDHLGRKRRVPATVLWIAVSVLLAAGAFGVGRILRHEADSGVRPAETQAVRALLPVFRVVNEPKVSIRVSEPHPPKVLFVLNFSESMNRRYANVTQSRFQSAVDAMHSGLDLVNASRGGAGLIAFGFRTRLAAGRAADDVELLVPLDSQDSVTKLRTALGRRSPTQTSPLYLAMRQAVRHVRQTLPQSPCQIVVITDSLDARGEDSSEVTREDVSAELNRLYNTEIAIVGVDVNETWTRDPQFEEFARWVSAEHRVSFIDLRDPQELSVAVSHAVSPFEFEVRQGRTSEKDTRPLGTVWSSSAAASETLKVALIRRFTSELFEALETHDVPAGMEGEVLNLELVGRPPRMEHHRWNAPPAEFGNEAELESFLVTFLQPSPAPSDPDTIRFRIAVRAREGGFTPRPRSVWVEVRPLINGAPIEATGFCFNRGQFEPGSPVPIQVCDIPASLWPAGADRAEVRAWFGTQGPPLRFNIPWSELVAGKARPTPVAGVSMQLISSESLWKRERRVILREKHDQPDSIQKTRLNVTPSPLVILKDVLLDEGAIEYHLEFDRQATPPVFSLSTKLEITGERQPAIGDSLPVEVP